MPNASEGPITVFDNSVTAINLALAQVLERLDRRAGLRGPSAIYDRTEVGGPVEQTEAVRLADLPSEQPTNPLYWLLRGQGTPLETLESQATLHAVLPLLLALLQMLLPRSTGGVPVETYTFTNVTTDRALDANATTLD